MSDLGNQHNNGPRPDQIFDNPLLSAWHCGPKIGFGSGNGCGVGVGRGTDAPNRLFTKGVRLSVSPFFCCCFSRFTFASDVPCLRSSGFKYDASAINYLLLSSSFFFSFFLHFDLKLFRTFSSSAATQVIIPANRNRA